MTTREPSAAQEEFERSFWAQVALLHAALAPHTGAVVVRPVPDEEAVEAAARTALAYARGVDSKGVWVVLRSIGQEFVRLKLKPPLAISEALLVPLKSGKRGGVQDPLWKSMRERTNADMVQYWCDQGLTVEESCARVSEFGPRGRGSESTVKRHYYKFYPSRKLEQ